MSEVILAPVVGILFAAGIYMMMRRSIVKLVIGMGLIGHGANLLIFVVGRVTEGKSPLIHGAEKHLEAPYANPVPQALILTAIVIGFAVLAFMLVLIREVAGASKTGDINEIVLTDRPAREGEL